MPHTALELLRRHRHMFIINTNILASLAHFTSATHEREAPPVQGTPDAEIFGATFAKSIPPESAHLASVPGIWRIDALQSQTFQSQTSHTDVRGDATWWMPCRRRFVVTSVASVSLRAARRALAMQPAV
eukprot:859470-Rhodomonas_salina.1